MAKIGKDAANRQEAEKIIQRAPNKGQQTRCLRAVAQMVILNGRILRNGGGLEPKQKSLGCGVYHVWYESWC